MAWLRRICLFLISALYSTSIFIPTTAIAEHNLIQSANASQFNGLFFKCRLLDEDQSMTVCGKFWWPGEVRHSAAAGRVKAILTFGVSVMVTSYASLFGIFGLQCHLSKVDHEKRRSILNRGLKVVLGLMVISVVSDVITCFLLAVNVDDIGIYPDARLGWGAYLLIAGSGVAVLCLILFTVLLFCYFTPRTTEAGYISFTNPASAETGGHDGAAYRGGAGDPDSVMTTPPPDLHDVNNRHNDGQAVELREKNDNLYILVNMYNYLIDYKHHEPPDKSIPIPSDQWTRPRR